MNSNQVKEFGELAQQFRAEEHNAHALSFTLGKKCEFCSNMIMDEDKAVVAAQKI